MQPSLLARNGFQCKSLGPTLFCLLADFLVFSLNYVCSGLNQIRYEAQLEKDWEFIVEDSDCKLIIAANKRIFDVVKNYVNKLGKVQHVICLENVESGDSYSTLLQQFSADINAGKIAEVPPLNTLTPQHVCTVIYTSGLNCACRRHHWFSTDVLMTA